MRALARRRSASTTASSTTSPTSLGRSRAHRSVYLGASPRASIGLLSAARALAAAEGRAFVIPDDVKALAPAVLRHRLILHPDAEIEGVSADDCVEDILREAKVPKTAGMIPSRALVLLAVVPLALAVATLADRTLLLPMLAADLGIALLAGLDALLARRPLVTRHAPRPRGALHRPAQPRSRSRSDPARAAASPSP